MNTTLKSRKNQAGYGLKRHIEIKTSYLSIQQHHLLLFYITILREFTDDVDLLYSKIKKYDVNYSNLDIRDSRGIIKEWKSQDYCFFPLLEHVKYHASNSMESVVKLDNDLTCLKPIDGLDDFSGILSWKFERNVSSGRDYWGEKYVCQVDASSVIRFKSHPELRSKTYATSDQTAVNWVFHKNRLQVTETFDYFNHHCYRIDAKIDCIKESEKYLRS